MVHMADLISGVWSAGYVELPQCLRSFSGIDGAVSSETFPLCRRSIKNFKMEMKEDVETGGRSRKGQNRGRET